MDKNRQKEHTYKARKKQIESNRAYIVKYKKNNPCIDCGERNPELLEFHHLNPQTKRFEICKGVVGRSHKQLREEMAGCVLLCKNCHELRHQKTIA
jgi:hypothetical protein